MSVKIKLSRIGRRNEPKYRLVIAPSGVKRDGKYIEKIGFYDPLKDNKNLTVNKDRYEYWIKVGAQPTDGVVKLLKNKLIYKKVLFS